MYRLGSINEQLYGYDVGYRDIELGRVIGAPCKDEILQWLKGKVVVNPTTSQYELEDSKGVRDGEIQQGRCYLFDGVDDAVDLGVAMASQTLTYFNGVSEQTVTTNSSGVITGITGKFGAAYQKDGSDNFLHFWHCDEQAGDKMYDCVKEWLGEELIVNGDFSGGFINGLANYWTTPFGLGTAVAEEDVGMLGVGISQRLDLYGQNKNISQLITLYAGRQYRFRMDLRTSCLMAVPGFYLRTTSGSYIATIVTIAKDDEWHSYDIIYTPTTDLVNCRIGIDARSVTTGSIWMSNVSVQELHEPSHGTIQNADLNDFHDMDNSFKSYQNEVGYSEGTTSPYITDVKVPIALDEDGTPTSLDIFGNTPTYLGLVKRNAKLIGGATFGAGTSLQQYPQPSLIAADTSNFWYATDGTAKVLPYTDIVDDVNNQIFADVTGGVKKNILTYAVQMTGDCLSKIYKFIKKVI